MPPTPIIQPLSAVRRSRGNHSVNALIEPISPADTPSPISARPAESIARSRASAEDQRARARDAEERGGAAPRAVAIERHAERQLDGGEREEVHRW